MMVLDAKLCQVQFLPGDGEWFVRVTVRGLGHDEDELAVGREGLDVVGGVRVVGEGVVDAALIAGAPELFVFLLSHICLRVPPHLVELPLILAGIFGDVRFAERALGQRRQDGGKAVVEQIVDTHVVVFGEPLKLHDAEIRHSLLDAHEVSDVDAGLGCHALLGVAVVDAQVPGHADWCCIHDTYLLKWII